MDPHRFDDLAKALTVPSRRAFLSAAAAAVLGGLLGGAREQVVAGPKKRTQGKSGKQRRVPTANAPSDVAAQPADACEPEEIRACNRKREECVETCREQGGARRDCRDRCDGARKACVRRCRRTPRACRVDADCNDADPCTRDVCNPDTRRCEFPAIAGCCTADDQCNDTNACTRDTCDLTTNTCVNQPTAGCCTGDAECATANPCTRDTCDVAAATCVHTVIEGCCRGDSECAGCQRCSAENRCVADASQAGAPCQASGADGTCCDGACVTCNPGQAVDPGTCTCANDGGNGCTAEQEAWCSPSDGQQCCPDAEGDVGFFCYSNEAACPATCPPNEPCPCTIFDEECTLDRYCCHTGFCGGPWFGTCLLREEPCPCFV